LGKGGSVQMLAEYGQRKSSCDSSHQRNWGPALMREGGGGGITLWFDATVLRGGHVSLVLNQGRIRDPGEPLGGRRGLGFEVGVCPGAKGLFSLLEGKFFQGGGEPSKNGRYLRQGHRKRGVLLPAEGDRYICSEE